MSTSAESYLEKKPFAPVVKFEALATEDSITLEDDGRPVVELPGDDREVGRFAAELGEILKAAEIFRRGDRLVVTPAEDGRGLRAVSDGEFRTMVEYRLKCYRWRVASKRTGSMRIVRTMSRDEASAVLQSSQFLEKLRVIEHMNDVPMPVRRQDGRVALLPIGYDAESRTLTANTLGLENLELEAARAEIDDLLQEFQFADERSRAVAVTAMVSLFTSGMQPPGSLRPAFVYLANAPGAGKTMAADCAVVPVFGRAFRTVMPERREELDKTVFAAVVAAHPVIFFDNARGHLGFGGLENVLTANHISGRPLGSSTTISAPNQSTVFITGNSLTMTADLQRRALICELFNESARPEDRVFAHRLSEAVLLERRVRILSALWSFVRHWDERGRPPPTKSRSGIDDWCDVVSGIVEAAGFVCPVTSPTLSGGGDADGADFAALVRAIFKEAGANNARDFKDLAKLSAQNGLFERIVDDEDGNLDRDCRARFGRLLTAKAGLIFNGEPPLRFVVTGKGHQRRFRVQPVAPEPDPH